MASEHGWTTAGQWDGGEEQQNDIGTEGMEEWVEWEEEQEDEAATDFYALLNVPRDATIERIRSSYHTLSLRFHPDKQPPHRRERTTAHFNHIQLAYETLVDPHKRTIYDTLGIDGLKQKAFDIGVKAMEPEEFKIWLQEQVRRHKVTEVMSLVNSRGDVNIALDVSGMQFQEGIEVVAPDGTRGLQLRKMPWVRLTKYVARHSFTVPLEGLGQVLTAPFPELARGDGAKAAAKAPPQIPALTLTAFLGGVPVQAKTGQQTYFAAPGLSANITHSFPARRPSAPVSVAVLLAGLDVDVAATLLPHRLLGVSMSKSFAASRLTLKPTFSAAPNISPPILEATFATSISARSTFFMQYNSGATHWPSALSALLSGPATTSHFTIGYTLLPATTGTSAPDPDNDDDAADATPIRRSSKKTETWRITAAAGPIVGGMQLGLSWGRTFFLGTPIGTPDPTTPRTPRSGIRINVDITTGFVLGLRASRRIFTHTRIGAGVSLSSKNGVILSLSWSRLGQRIVIPVVVAPLIETTSVLYALVLPAAGYGLFEVLWLQPRMRALRGREKDAWRRRRIVQTERAKRRAEEVVALMEEGVETAQKRRGEEGGLVVVDARYGVRVGAGRGVGEGSIDVTVAVAALIEGEQVVVPRGVNKNHITGFYDPAPGEKKALWVKYLFKGKLHEITVGPNHALVIPMRAHCLE